MSEKCKTVAGPNGRLCGAMYMSVVVLCDYHEAEARVAYPQGWVAYPGDTCRHGVYVGGCGADYMCGRCEAGEG